ncbi:MAG TPA: LLM class F420-dependent oxidoreductase [Acidimicrobiales bacterium]|nr:LLM class F420-dependent oxidoreductase [Acidimicrobiales bacterium]
MRLGIAEVGIEINGRDGSWFVEAARTIEQVGFDSVWVPQRIVSRSLGDDPHPYGADRDVANMRRHGAYDSIASLAAAAAVTSRVRLGTYVDLTALRHPFITAQQVATVDQLSNGRVNFGMGSGWYEDEFVLIGSDFADRGPRVTEYLQAIKALWTTETTTFHGRFLDFEQAVVGPKPVQRPHPPILVGGNSPATLSRIVAAGDGWLGYGIGPDEIARIREQLRERMEAVGRDPDEATVTIGWRMPGGGVDMTPDEINRDAWKQAAEFAAGCAEIGVDEVIFTVRIPPDGYADNLAGFADTVGLDSYH